MLRTLTLVCSLLMFNVQAFAADVDLTFQSLFSDMHTQAIEVLIPWTESFSKDSNGKFIVQNFGTAAIVEPKEVAAAVKNGLLDLGGWGPASDPKLFPYTYMGQLPFLVKNSVQGTKLFNQMYNDFPQIKKEVDSIGVPVAIWASGVTGFASIKTPILSPADLKGKRVLTISPSESVAVEAWGGVPVFVAPSDVYVGLQRGMGEVLYTGLPMMKGLRVHEVAKSLTIVPTSVNYVMISLNQQVFDDFTKEQQSFFLEHSKNLSMDIALSLDKETEVVSKLFTDNGVPVILPTPEQLQSFENAMKQTIDTYWVDALTKAGVKNSKEEMEKVYKLSNSISIN